MQIVYYSFANNTKRFVNKLDTELEIVTIDNYNKAEQFILITPTYNYGGIPDPVSHFLELNGRKLLGVISSGNRNWGEVFAQAGNKIASLYDVPLLHKFEMSGNEKDVEIVNNILKRYY